ncbi:hypothetical protein PINS_up008899 [Pythium insidiosum]|nr:hypothetical protein PINS_up008899 [Pythium insidiosum]
MGRYCKPGEKKGMQLAEFLVIMDRYQVYNDQFRLRDLKDPFLACKLVVLDEMATVGHKKLFLTDFMELLLRVAVLRYPPRPPLTVADVAKSLQTLFQQHFLRHEVLLDQLREAVDEAVVQHRIEQFAEAIHAQKAKQHPKSKGGVKRASRGSNGRASRGSVSLSPPRATSASERRRPSPAEGEDETIREDSDENDDVDGDGEEENVPDDGDAQDGG